MSEKWSDSWRTPQQLFDELDSMFHFKLDAAADSENTKIEFAYLTKEDDALSLPNWGRVIEPSKPVSIFLNPPLSQGAGPLIRWVRQAYLNATLFGHLVVAVLPATPNTNWHHCFVRGKAGLWTPKGRIKFEPPPGHEFREKEDGSKEKRAGGRHDTNVVVWAGRLSLRGFWS